MHLTSLVNLDIFKKLPLGDEIPYKEKSFPTQTCPYHSMNMNKDGALQIKI